MEPGHIPLGDFEAASPCELWSKLLTRDDNVVLDFYRILIIRAARLDMKSFHVGSSVAAAGRRDSGARKLSKPPALLGHLVVVLEVERDLEGRTNLVPGQYPFGRSGSRSLVIPVFGIHRMAVILANFMEQPGNVLGCF